MRTTVHELPPWRRQGRGDRRIPPHNEGIGANAGPPGLAEATKAAATGAVAGALALALLYAAGSIVHVAVGVRLW